ncbi:MAG: hypothetical protein MUC87_17565 [Bacteroidia bacterium]|jgi:hypothetical protein|nr:hypothetical protein [Bacteroidia bacterium]
MSADFNIPKCLTNSSKEKFGLCDDPDPAKNPAYIDETDDHKWIAVVENPNYYEVTFLALDYCIDDLREDGTQKKRCDGVLTYTDNIIFVELKERNEKGSKWIKDAEKQLKQSIEFCENEGYTTNYRYKKAYISNSKRPRERSGQQARMNSFFESTGYVLRIQARIELQ